MEHIVPRLRSPTEHVFFEKHVSNPDLSALIGHCSKPTQTVSGKPVHLAQLSGTRLYLFSVKVLPVNRQDL